MIATEEAVLFPDVLAAYERIVHKSRDPDARWWKALLSAREPPALLRRLLDVGQERRDIMDASGCGMQLLALTFPGVQMFDAATGKALAISVNDQLAEVVAANPARYAALASVAPQDPAAAANEIDRAINRLGLRGVQINSHTHGEYLDQEKFWPILEAAESVGAPIYLHPRNLPAEYAPLLDGTRARLFGPVWGFGVETSAHAVRLIASGVFDRFPRLALVLGHLGEGLPFWLHRLDSMADRTPSWRSLARRPSDYISDNIAITTSGMSDPRVLRYCCDVLSADNILFAIDYPYEEADVACEFIRSAPLSEDERERIGHRNAEALFRLPV